MDALSEVLFLPGVVLAVFTAGHALLYKRDSRAALGWVAVCLVFPLYGPLLYLTFGINRIHTRARRLKRRHGKQPRRVEPDDAPPAPTDSPPVPLEFINIVRISEAMTGRPIVAGNHIRLLENGEQAYPAMLAAIGEARERIFLSTYIFDTDRTGRRFVRSLTRAHRRGIDVRVLLDGIGGLYSWPRAASLLRKRGVPVARFLPPRLLPPAVHINLRNHRKILTIDGHTAFTGGMNIRDRHLLHSSPPAKAVMDTHCLMRGSVAAQIETAFREDWRFTTGQVLPPSVPAAGGGGALCRLILDGPNEDFDRLATILVGAISAARKSVAIITPYFLPTREMIGALQAAALRGVTVKVLLPGKNNLPPVQWASTNMMWEMLARGVRVFLHPPPFIHTKLFIVDDYYAVVGSANLDPRSLRLNFELCVEIYGTQEASRLTDYFQSRLHGAREISLKEVDNRPLPVRVRDSLAWLFSPYL